MIFVTGGAAQGKRKFAMDYFPGAMVMAAYQMTVEQCIKDGKDPLSQVEAMLSISPDVIIIMSEMGSGIVPVDSKDRILRDEVGRVGCYLAERAEEVYRVVAGLGMRIK